MLDNLIVTKILLLLHPFNSPFSSCQSNNTACSSSMGAQLNWWCHQDVIGDDINHWLINPAPLSVLRQQNCVDVLASWLTGRHVEWNVQTLQASVIRRRWHQAPFWIILLRQHDNMIWFDMIFMWSACCHAGCILQSKDSLLYITGFITVFCYIRVACGLPSTSSTIEQPLQARVSFINVVCVIWSDHDKKLDALIKAEMAVFESSGRRGCSLQQASLPIAPELEDRYSDESRAAAMGAGVQTRRRWRHVPGNG